MHLTQVCDKSQNGTNLVGVDGAAGLYGSQSGGRHEKAGSGVHCASSGVGRAHEGHGTLLQGE